MKSFTKEEFINYIKNLEFNELEDCAEFVTTYYEHYIAIPSDKKEEKDEAWERYMILMAKFGMMFVTFTAAVIEYRKKLNEELDQLKKENSSGESLESGTS
jgi:hypothetical protein